MDATPVLRKWQERYGGAIDVPMPFGMKRIMLFDPKAIATFLARDTYEYQHGDIIQHEHEKMVGRVT